ncbi:MAG TPA: hypothetical protein VHE33_10465 [Acidobacteriaceae bacterium]|nr:hypothetical protein [Acidobacteriaceae bacterium]
MERDRPRDARVLRDAAEVVREYSTRPASFWCTVLVRVLRRAAARIEAGGW